MVGTGSRQAHRKRRSAAFVAVAAIGLGLVSGATSPTTAAVSGSSFDAENGTLDPAGSGRTIVAHADEPSGGRDDSYSGGGPKEDDPCPTVDLSHAAPPKADITKFWHGTDRTAPGVLYLAWERKSATGTLTVDFELNHSTTRCANGVNPVREDGDLLVTYDFQGGTAIVVEVREWLSTDVWGPIQALSATHYDASIRADQSFGELAVDLVGANLLDTGASAACEVFAGAFAKTRTGASSAFQTSTVKDFITPVTTSISNCATLTIVKDAQPDAADDFAFTTSGSDLSAFTLDDDADPTRSDTQVFTAHPGAKTVAETSTAGWDLEDISCTGTGADDVNIGADDHFDAGDTQVSVDLAIGDDITCTYVNTKPGTITISKDAAPDNARDFSFTSTGGNLGDFVLDDDADATRSDAQVFTNVGPGRYSFTEAAAAGWSLESIDCGTSTTSVDLATRTVAFTFGQGDSVSCTFTNEKTPPAIVVTKDAAPTSVAEPGGNVAFAVTVTNSSPLAVTVTDVADSVYGDLADEGNAGLVSTTCDDLVGVVLAAADANGDDDEAACTFTAFVGGNAGAVHENVVTVSGEDADGVAVSSTDDAVVAVTDVRPRIDVTKTASTTTIHAGDPVTYSYVVTNPGIEPLSVTMSDDKCAPVTFVGGDTVLNPGKLDPTESWRYTCTPDPALSVTTTNVITAVGTDDEGNQATDTANATVTVIRPAISVDKTPSTSSVVPGDTVLYTYVVTNPGDVPLSGVGVVDDKCTPVTFVGGDADGDGRLQVGESWTYTCSQVQTGAVDTLTNVATARGTDVLGRTVSATDTVTVAAVLPVVLERPTLPRTGDEVTGWLQLAGSLLLLGFALVVASRVRPGPAG